MQALRFSEGKGLRLEQVPLPSPGDRDVLIKVRRAGVCNTDLELMKGYVPGYDLTLGHEFVGDVVSCPADPSLVGRRVVGEINCRCDANYAHPDPIFVRNHAPERTVLGIIAKDGCMAEYVTLPRENLFAVPEELTDAEACFAEPLAAACRVVEQKAVRPGDKAAVIGDGKLGLLVAQLLAVQGYDVTHIGRHARKLALVEGTRQHLVTDQSAAELSHRFDATVEASGSEQGIALALAITRPLGTVVLKSTCAASTGADAATWASVGNVAVVNEVTLVGSRCGPFAPALEALRDARVRRLVNAMLDATLPLSEGAAAVERAQRPGALKVQLVMFD